MDVNQWLGDKPNYAKFQNRYEYFLDVAKNVLVNQNKIDEAISYIVDFIYENKKMDEKYIVGIIKKFKYWKINSDYKNGTEKRINEEIELNDLNYEFEEYDYEEDARYETIIKQIENYFSNCHFSKKIIYQEMYVNNKKGREIAKEKGIHENTVGTIKKKMLTDLKKILKNEK